MTGQLPPERPETDAAARSPHLVPWITVGVIAVLAIVVSILVVTLFRGSLAADDPAPATPETSAPAQPKPDETEEPEQDPEPEDDGAPTVELGSTFDLDISQWGTEVKMSVKFADMQYTMPSEDRLIISAPLIDGLPSSCKAMRGEFGFERVGAQRLEVLRPAERCSDDPELYDEIWGLLAASADTATKN